MARKKSQSDIQAQYSRIYEAAKGQGTRLQKAAEIATRYANNARAYALSRGHYESSAHLVPVSRRVYMGLSNG